MSLPSHELSITAHTVLDKHSDDIPPE